MKFGQWMVVVKHDEDPSLVGKVVVICAPLWWNSYEDRMIDVQIDNESTTFIHESGLRPLKMDKEVRKELINLYNFS